MPATVPDDSTSSLTADVAGPNPQTPATRWRLRWSVTDWYEATFTAADLWQYLDARQRRRLGNDINRLDPALFGDALAAQMADLEREETYAGTGESHRQMVEVRLDNTDDPE